MMASPTVDIKEPYLSLGNRPAVLKCEIPTQILSSDSEVNKLCSSVNHHFAVVRGNDKRYDQSARYYYTERVSLKVYVCELS